MFVAARRGISRYPSKRPKALVYSIFIDEYAESHALVLEHSERVRQLSYDHLLTE